MFPAPNPFFPFLLLLLPTIHAALLPRDYCFGGDPISRICYGSPNGGPQNLNVSDITSASSFLRAHGRGTTPAGFLSMAATGPNDCTRATLYTQGTVRVVAKHFNFTHATAVLWEDVADAIDGGEEPSAAQREHAVLGCGWKGGQVGVNASQARMEYHTQEFLARGASTHGIVVMLVSSAS